MHTARPIQPSGTPDRLCWRACLVVRRCLRRHRISSSTHLLSLWWIVVTAGPPLRALPGRCTAPDAGKPTFWPENVCSTGLDLIRGADAVTLPGVAHEGRYDNQSARRWTSLWDSWRRLAATQTTRGSRRLSRIERSSCSRFGAIHTVVAPGCEASIFPASPCRAFGCRWLTRAAHTGTSRQPAPVGALPVQSK